MYWLHKKIATLILSKRLSPSRLCFALAFVSTCAHSVETLCATGSAEVTRNNGFVIRGEIVSLTSSQVRIRSGRRLLEFKAKDVREVRTADDTFKYNPATRELQSAKAAADEARRRALLAAAEARQRRVDAEAARSGRVKVVNNTNKPVDFVITRLRDVEGNDLVLDDGRTKSDLEQIGGALNLLFSKGRSRSPEPLRWHLEPGETAYLKSDGDSVVTSNVYYTLITSDGSKELQVTKKNPGRDFVIPIDEDHLHSPVLVSVGGWNVEQDIWYTTHRARRPTTIVPVTGLFSDKIMHYEVLGGDEYDYSQEHRSGYATAWTPIENPTDKTLKVTATVEFHFAHLILSNQRVHASISVPPRTKTKMYITVNTRALIGNRKATSVRQINVTTTEE